MMNSTPKTVIYMVIGILGVIAGVGMLSLCLTLFYKNYADPAVLTAIISITSGAIGSLGTMLVNTRSNPPASNGPPGEGVPVVVKNSEQAPVATHEIEKKP